MDDKFQNAAFHTQPRNQPPSFTGPITRKAVQHRVSRSPTTPHVSSRCQQASNRIRFARLVMHETPSRIGEHARHGARYRTEMKNHSQAYGYDWRTTQCPRLFKGSCIVQRYGRDAWLRQIPWVHLHVNVLEAFKQVANVKYIWLHNTSFQRPEVFP